MRWNVERKAPDPPNISKARQASATRELVIEDLTLVTPMLGGGVTALTPDKGLVLRGQAVRGQLRFWWRTLQKCTEVAELWEKEAMLWGSTSLASRVGVRGEMVRQPVSKHYVANNKANPLPKYVAFPLDNDPSRKQFELLEKGAFRLIISYPANHEEEVLSSVKLWMLFGGLGARTRRGLGAVYAPKWPGWKSKDQVMDTLKKLVPHSDGIQRSWPSLINAQLLAVSTSEASLLHSWTNWIEKYQKFRQHRVDKKDPRKKSPYGKSTWPEPDTLRDFRKSNKIPASAYFPRGAYGLPIIFHFPPKHGDMSFTLQGVDSDRLASPFIIKTAKITDHTALNICLLLSSTLPEKMIVAEERKKGLVLPGTAMPLADNPQMARSPLNGQNPHAALLTWMGGAAKPLTLGGAG